MQKIIAEDHAMTTGQAVTYALENIVLWRDLSDRSHNPGIQDGVAFIALDMAIQILKKVHSLANKVVDTFPHAKTADIHRV